MKDMLHATETSDSVIGGAQYNMLEESDQVQLTRPGKELLSSASSTTCLSALTLSRVQSQLEASVQSQLLATRVADVLAECSSQPVSQNPSEMYQLREHRSMLEEHLEQVASQKIDGELSDQASDPKKPDPSTTDLGPKMALIPWKPSRFLSSSYAPHGDNAVTLMPHVLSLKIDTEEKLRTVVDLIFEKAVNEPCYAEAYANMCRQMTSFRIAYEEGTDQVEFRKLLLTRLQREFGRSRSDEQRSVHTEKIKGSVTTKVIGLTAGWKLRKRAIASIVFIGELFKLKMLTEGVMHNCIMSLFKAKDDHHLECLCWLLVVIGKDLDHQKGKCRMDQYFDQIRKIISAKNTSFIVRIMLQDVVDLRVNKWVRRIPAQLPQTISKIHEDARAGRNQKQYRRRNRPHFPRKRV